MCNDTLFFDKLNDRQISFYSIYLRLYDCVQESPRNIDFPNFIQWNNFINVFVFPLSSIVVSYL